MEHCFGESGKSLIWMASYLSDQYQSECVECKLSEFVLIEYYTRQGSVFVPKHYLRYMKPLDDVIRTDKL